jgi:hypothetical protein
MAGPSLTAGSTLMCPHGGQVTIIPANTRSIAGGTSIATTADIFIIAGCAFTLPGPVPSPCVQIQWIMPGLRVKAGGAQALDAGSVGLCIGATGAPQGPVSIQSTQANVTGT